MERCERCGKERTAWVIGNRSNPGRWCNCEPPAPGGGPGEMSTDYSAVLSLAGVHLQRAWDAFCEDPLMPWREIGGRAPRERTKVWVDALRQALAHHEQIERHLSR